MKAKTKTGIEQIINEFKNNPSKFYNDVWECYSQCKREIQKMENEGTISWGEYEKYINYVVDKLGV